MTPQDAFIRDMWWLLQAIKKERLSTYATIEFEIAEGSDGAPPATTQRNMLRRLRGWHTLKSEPQSTPGGGEPTKFYLDIDDKQFNNIYNIFKNGIGFGIDSGELYELANHFVRPMSFTRDEITERAWEVMRGKLPPGIKIAAQKEAPTAASKAPRKYKISVQDRNIWINDYLIGKPHAVGSNFEFFDYVRHQPANTKIERRNLPTKFGDLSIQEQVKTKSFIKMLNELGFKGEILKAFFYQRSKDSLNYRGDEISSPDLESAGIKLPLFLKELELAHAKNSPG